MSETQLSTFKQIHLHTWREHHRITATTDSEPLAVVPEALHAAPEAAAATALAQRVRAVSVERAGEHARDGEELDERPRPRGGLGEVVQAELLLRARQLVALRVGAREDRRVRRHADDAVGDG